jgi:hypothetical protein
MTIYAGKVQMRAGATPYTFDGDQDLQLNDKAKRLVGMLVSHSLSTYTTDEGVGMVVRLKSSSNWSHEIEVPAGMVFPAGPATNNAVKLAPAEFIPLDLELAPNTVITVDITTWAGATQTGTNDVTITLLYDDGNTPADILAAMSNIVGMKGCGWGYLAANAATTRAALSTFTIPSHAREIIAGKFLLVHDTAVTASEEITGYIEIDLGITGQGDQHYAINGGSPNLGTEVEGGVPEIMPFVPMHIPLPGKEITVKPYINAYSTITGGAQVLCALAWR